MEDGISMATKRQITLRFRDEYMKASKKDKGRILDEMCSVLAIGRSTARRRLAEAGRGRPSPPPEERLKRYSEQSRDLLVRVWLMMDLPCAKYLNVFCQVGVGRFGVSFSPCERRVSGRFGVGRSCWLLVIALVIA